MGKPAPER